MNKKETITIEINVSYGSKFQYKLFNDLIEVFLNALGCHFIESHNDNKFSLEAITNERQKIINE